MKTCACGKTYSRPAWLALPLLGVGFYDFVDVEECHEYRNCASCGSTLSRRIAQRRPDGSAVVDDPADLYEALRATADKQRRSARRLRADTAKRWP